MEQTAAARLLSAEDVVLEIFLRVSTDAVALFRCAAACKRWCALVADRSFLRRCWPEDAGRPSTLLGFIVRQGVEVDEDVDGRLSYRLLIVPPPVGSVLGAQPRLLSSIVDGLPDDDSHSTELLAGRRGLLLVRLISENLRFESVQMAVCDPVTRSCHVLPPLECRVLSVSCAVLTGAECCSSEGQHQDSLNSFMVLAITFVYNPTNEYDAECNLYTFSSTESRWSAPIEINQLRKRGFQFPTRNDSSVVRGAVAHWLIPFFLDYNELSINFYTLDVSTRTGHTSLKEISIPAEQFDTSRIFCTDPKLGVTTDGALSLFYMLNEPPIRQLHIWKRGNGVESDIWLHTRVVKINLPRQPNISRHIQIWLVEKSDKLIIVDESQCMHKIDVETEAVEEVHQFQNVFGTWVIPMTVEWPTLFASRLGYVLE